MININTQSNIIPTQIGQTFNITEENSRELLLSLGWRDEVIEPILEEGYTRISKRFIEDDGQKGKWEVVDKLTTEIEAEALQARYQSLVDNDLLPIAQAYGAKLNSIFGEGAVTNQNITEKTVFGYFFAKNVTHTMTDDDRDDKDLLQNAFIALTEWNCTGETWTLPWSLIL